MVSENLQNVIIKCLISMGFKIVNNNSNLVRFVDPEINIYMNLAWEDILNQYNRLGIDVESNYEQLRKKALLDDVFYNLSEDLQLFKLNHKTKIWAQRVNGSNDLWLYGYLKDNVGEFSVELDIKQLDKFALSAEEFNNPEVLMQAFNKHKMVKINLFTRLRIENIEVEISNPSNLYKFIFLWTTSLKMSSQLNDVQVIRLKHVNFKNVHGYIQQSIFLFNILNEFQLTFGMDEPNGGGLLKENEHIN